MRAESNSSSGQPQQVNLQQIAQQFMSGLQRHFDMLAFNLASREAAQEDSYNQRVNAPRIMPAAPRHQNFEQMQAYARDLLVRQVIGDSLNLTVTAMNNAHFFLALVKATNANKDVTPDAQKMAQQSQQAFIPAQLDEKFNRLEKDYGIMCELEDSITSLGFVMQILMQQGGIVKEAQVDEQGELAIELKSVEIQDAGGAAEQPQGKLVDLRWSRSHRLQIHCLNPSQNTRALFKRARSDHRIAHVHSFAPHSYAKYSAWARAFDVSGLLWGARDRAQFDTDRPAASARGSRYCGHAGGRRGLALE
jgi:hypothetical protein